MHPVAGTENRRSLTSLRFGRDDNSYFGKVQVPKKISPQSPDSPVTLLAFYKVA